jgi:hypothetical protein
MKNLMLLRHDQLIEFFPDIKRVKGLMYVEPAALKKTLADLEQTTAPPSPLPENSQ